MARKKSGGDRNDSLRACHKAYAEYLRAVMEHLGMDREVFRSRIRCQPQTLANALSGSQGLGPHYKERVEALFYGRKAGGGAVLESGGRYECTRDRVERLAQLMANPDYAGSLALGAKTLGVTPEDAASIVIDKVLQGKDVEVDTDEGEQ